MARMKLPLVLLVALASTAARRAPPPAPAPAAPTAAPATIKTGVEKWRAGDYAAAVAIWTPFAAAGEPDALFNLGQAYKLGRGVAADAATARDYYRRAAAKGHLPAQANLGIALFQSGDKVEAIRWLKTAADRGEARAQYVLGIATFNGDGVPRSQAVGYGYLLRAQASGLPQAVTALGTIAPGLSPADRTAGEAVAASLAAGTGVPAALVAVPSRSLTPAAPTRPTGAVVPTAGTTATLPPPRASAAAGSTVTPMTAPPAPAPTRTVAGVAVVARPAPVAAAAGDKPALPPVPRPAPATPLSEPTPAQADTAATRDPARRDGPVPIGIVAVPASKPATSPAAASPAGRAERPVPEPRTAAGIALSAALKPFQTVDAAAKKPDGWRVQLGAFSSRKLADAAWADAKASAGPAKPIFATDGPVTKLQMGPFGTRDAAKAACTKLTAAGRACFVTAG